MRTASEPGWIIISQGTTPISKHITHEHTHTHMHENRLRLYAQRNCSPRPSVSTSGHAYFHLFIAIITHSLHVPTNVDTTAAAAAAAYAGCHAHEKSVSASVRVFGLWASECNNGCPFALHCLPGRTVGGAAWTRGRIVRIFDALGWLIIDRCARMDVHIMG